MDGQKRGLVLVGVALVAALAFGFVGYSILSKGAESSSIPAQAEDAQAQGTSTDAVATSVKESDSSDFPLLADYDATVYTEAGDAVRLSAIANGKPLVINFWATWCPYCLEEMPSYQQLYHEYGDRVAFAFVDQADGSRETADMAREWLEQNGYADLPAYYDTALEASYMFAAQALPTTVVVSADGRVQAVTPGMIDLESMRTTLDSLV